MTTKKCTKCKENKPLSSYSKDKKNKDGYRGWCRRCSKAYSEEWRTKNKEQISLDGKRRYASKPAEYSTWYAMKGRCNNPNHENYKYYGGRGITICDAWSSFDTFLTDIGSKPSSQHQLHRKDSDGNYEPSNCEWVEARYHAKLHRLITPKMVSVMKMLKRERVKQRYISIMVGASEAMVSEIVNGKRYADEGLPA